jgi:LPS-assembly protein
MLPARALARPWLWPACALALAVSPPCAAAEPQAGLPVTLEADRLRATPDRDATAEGGVVLRQGGLLIRADRLRYDVAAERAAASGAVLIEREGLRVRGDAVELGVRDFSGWFIAPEFDFLDLGTRGQAARIDFASRTRMSARQARYTSCPRPADGDAGAEPDWQLEAREVTLDFDANEGIAKGARLRFLGVTLLALPRLSFPVTDARKSGWLPPTVNLDSRSGLELSVPYYWNIAPDRDATLAPRVSTRRGLALEGEFRYLAPRWQGELLVDALPYDRVAGGSRHALAWQHSHRPAGELALAVDLARVSDDNWWKDFPRRTPGPWPRLLASSAWLDQPWQWRGWRGSAYALAQDWQVLQDEDAPIVAPYARRPQLGAHADGSLGPFDLRLRSELNRFERVASDAAGDRLEGWRWHATGELGWAWRSSWGFVLPRLSINAAEYRTDTPMDDGRRHAARWIPSASVDAGLVFERDASYFGRALRQTLEPRLLYVRTAYRRQDLLPNFDAWGRDFDFDSVYARNAFAGVDRVSDANQLTVGATSRLLDPATGAELLRLGAVQRVLFSDQRVTPQADGSADGEPLTQRVSDLLLLGSTTIVPGWAFDASLQYSPETRRMNRSVLGATWSPGPFRTLSGRYRLARGASEQFELGWQWPVYGADAGGRGGPGGAGGAGGAACGGSWYGVGRINYSIRDSRITDSLLGAEYDAGCWIARIVGERVSTGRSEATTRLLLQLELVGLSRLGSNPLRVLKDNIPGYRLLREERGEEPSAWPPTRP